MSKKERKKSPPCVRVNPYNTKRIGLLSHCKSQLYGKDNSQSIPNTEDLFFDKPFDYNRIYVPNDKTTIYFGNTFKQNLDSSCCSLPYHHHITHYCCTSQSSARFPLSDFMNVIKKVNIACSSLIVALVYILGIGLSWILHVLTQHRQKSSDSYWIPNQKKRLPKKYFSSPY